MSTSGNTVKSFLKELNDEDFSTARTFLNDGVKFIGVMGTRDGADTYITDMAKMKFKYNIQKLFEDGNDVSVFYDINMGGPTIFSSGWYQLSNGKISVMKVLFDPRPLLEKKQ